jgi:hypothetical protein
MQSERVYAIAEAGAAPFGWLHSAGRCGVLGVLRCWRAPAAAGWGLGCCYSVRSSDCCLVLPWQRALWLSVSSQGLGRRRSTKLLRLLLLQQSNEPQTAATTTPV